MPYHRAPEPQHSVQVLSLGFFWDEGWVPPLLPEPQVWHMLLAAAVAGAVLRLQHNFRWLIRLMIDDRQKRIYSYSLTFMLAF